MGNQSLSILIRPAVPADLPVCKFIADSHKHELGFLPRAVFADAIYKRNLLVAESTDSGTVLAFVRYNHRKKGSQTAIYDICVDQSYYRLGVGRALIHALASDCRNQARTSIVLKCPEGLHANEFYRSVGFQRIGVEAGRRRSLVVWQLELS